MKILIVRFDDGNVIYFGWYPRVLHWTLEILDLYPTRIFRSVGVVDR